MESPRAEPKPAHPAEWQPPPTHHVWQEPDRALNDFAERWHEAEALALHVTGGSPLSLQLSFLDHGLAANVVLHFCSATAVQEAREELPACGAKRVRLWRSSRLHRGTESEAPAPAPAPGRAQKGLERLPACVRAVLEDARVAKVAFGLVPALRQLSWRLGVPRPKGALLETSPCAPAGPKALRSALRRAGLAEVKRSGGGLEAWNALRLYYALKAQGAQLPRAAEGAAEARPKKLQSRRALRRADERARQELERSKQRFEAELQRLLKRPVADGDVLVRRLYPEGQYLVVVSMSCLAAQYPLELIEVQGEPCDSEVAAETYAWRAAAGRLLMGAFEPRGGHYCPPLPSQDEIKQFYRDCVASKAESRPRSPSPAVPPTKHRRSNAPDAPRLRCI